MTTLEEFEELNGQLIATRKLIREQERLLNMMASMDVQLREARKQLSPLVTRLKYEKADVEVLESLSLEAAFFALLGRREQQLEKEVREYLEVKMQVEACQIRISSLERSLEKLESDLVDIIDCEETYASLQQEQEALIVQLGTPESSRLAEVTQALAVNERFLKEAQEAYEAGQAALERLTAVTTALLELRSWDGVWGQEFKDTGHGDFAQIVALARETQPLLDRLQAELLDVEQQFFTQPDMKIPTDAVPTMISFTGTLFDLFFTETLASADVRDWYTHLTTLRRRITLRVDLLAESLQITNGRLTQLQQKRSDLVALCWSAEQFGG